MPRSLLGRSLLMILLPLVLLQAVALQIFYGSHLDIVSRRLSGRRRRRDRPTRSICCDRFPDPRHRAWILGSRLRSGSGWTYSSSPARRCRNAEAVNVLGPMDDDLAAALNETFICRSPWTGPPTRIRC